MAVARGDQPADLVLKGGRVLSVFTGELLEVDVAVADRHVAGLGSYDGLEVVNVDGLILLPGFIDAHMHLESTKLMIDEFARAVLPSGTTTVVLDPHEIANVFGLKGVSALLGASADVPLDVYVMVSSCVPASQLESNGATVSAEDIARFLSSEPSAIGLAEVMDVPGVIGGSEEVLAKIAVAHRAGGHLDGHAPGLSGKDLNAYVAAGIRSDHECTSYGEALEKRRLGMWIMIREGSAARNVEALAPLVREFGPGNCMLCTDDREPDHLLRDGHVNDVMRRAVELGCQPSHVVEMATLFPARYHRLHEHGAVAPGYIADIVAVEDLKLFTPHRVWKRGRLVASGGECAEVPRAVAPDWMRGSVRVREMTSRDFAIYKHDRVRVIGVDPGTIVTRALTARPLHRDGEAIPDPSRDLAKIAVVERHRGTGRVGLGFVSGFGLARGALASTHAHDSHNIVVMGMDEGDMATAVNRLAEIGGGQVAVASGTILAELPCPIGGLLSDRPVEEVAVASRNLDLAARQLGVTLSSPFMAMSFLALTVIPELKITDRGLVDTRRHAVVPLQA